MRTGNTGYRSSVSIDCKMTLGVAKSVYDAAGIRAEGSALAVDHGTARSPECCVYRKPKSEHSDDEARRGSRVIRSSLSAEQSESLGHPCPVTGAS